MGRNIRVRFFRRRSRGPTSRFRGEEAPSGAPSAPPGPSEPFEPFPDGVADAPDPALTDSERRSAEEEARSGIPTAEAIAPSPGERRVESRFLEAMARIRARADGVLGRLQAQLHEARTRAVRLETDAARERERLASLSGVHPACQRIEARYFESQTAEKELAGFRRQRGIPDYATPRPPGRGWAWLLLAVAFAETTANGLLLHSASTEGAVSNWLFAALVTAMNVGLLGWLIGDLICRRMLRAGPLRRSLLAAALVPCLFVAGLLHFGFAHYRDAVQALDGSRAAAALDLDDIDAGAEDGAAPADPHPPPAIGVEEAVIGELRAQFLWWRPGGSVTDHPPEIPPADHSLDTVRELEAGELGYRADGGSLVRVEDPMAGRFEGWRSALLLAVGFMALLLSAWKWFGGREPLPHFSRLYRSRAKAARTLEQEYSRALAAANEAERRHQERLGDVEAEILDLGGRLTTLDGRRRETLTREADLLRRSAAAATSAIEDYREANRQRRLSQDPPPALWAEPWRPALPPRDADAEAVWDRQRAQGLVEIMEAAERVRLANGAHADGAAAAFEGARERLAQAARLPGARRRPPAPRGGGAPPPRGGSEVRLVPRGADEVRRLEAAS